MIAVPRPKGARAIAETVAEAALIASASYIVINESFANWQAVWFCAAVATLSVILSRARDVPRLKMRRPTARPARSALCSTMPKADGSERERHQDDRRPEQIERGSGQRHPAEDVVIEQHDGQPERIAQPSVQAAWQASDTVLFSSAM